MQVRRKHYSVRPSGSHDRAKLFLGVTVAAVILSCSGVPDEPVRGQLLDAAVDPFYTPVDFQRLGEYRVGHYTLSAVEFRQQHVLDQVVAVGQDSVLEYTPFFDGGATEVELSAVVRSEGENITLSTVKVAPLDELKRNPGESLQRRRVRIDLSQFRRKKIRIKWTVRAPESTAKVILVDPRVRPATRARPPDILIVCSDTHRFDSSLGGEGTDLMPRLTEFSTGATTYKRAYSPSSWTLPAISSIYTGLWPRFHGTGARVDLIDRADFDRSKLSRGEFVIEWPENFQVLTTFARSLPTIQNTLRAYGYTTVLVNANVLYHMAGVSGAGFSAALTLPLAPGKLLNQRATKYIRSQPADEPLFLVVHYMDVHEYKLRRDKLRRGEEFEARPVEERRRLHRETYTERVRNTDRNFGDLLSVWKESRSLENSLIIFCSDHGEHILDDGEMRNWRQLGHGQTMDDVLLHVPLIVSYPRQLQAGDVVPDPVSLLDIAPTLLDVANIPSPPGTFQGVSLVADNTGDGLRWLFADYQLFADSLGSLRRGSKKLVLNLDRNEKTLLDCESEPCALVDKSHTSEGEEAEFESAYWNHAAAAKEASSIPLQRHDVDPEEALDHLRSLGYVK